MSFQARRLWAAVKGSGFRVQGSGLRISRIASSRVCNSLFELGIADGVEQLAVGGAGGDAELFEVVAGDQRRRIELGGGRASLARQKSISAVVPSTTWATAAQ